MAIEDFPRPPHLHTIFVDTSIDTHLALDISLHDTVRNVKAKIRAEHALCFQNVGEISIQAIKVKRRGFFYLLADSMYVSNAFDGVKGAWFFCIDVVSMCPPKNQEVVSNKAHDAAISPPEAGKNSCHDGRGHHDTISADIDNVQRPEMLVVQEKDKKRRKKTKNDSDEQLHDDQRRGSKFSRSHNIDESSKSPEISCGGKKFLFTSLEGLQSNLTTKDTDVLQNSRTFEKQNKKRKRKSSKSHEEAHLPMSSETLLSRSPQVNTLPHGSAKESDISILLGNIDKVLPSDGRHMRATTDNVSSIEVVNQQEKDAPSLETRFVIIPSVNKEPIEDQILHVNPEDRRAKNVNSAQGTKSDELVYQPRHILKHMEANGQECRSSTQVDSEVSIKLRRRMKKSKEKSSKRCESSEVNGNLEHFNSHSAQVSRSDTQNVFIAAESIKQADRTADGGHCTGIVSETSSTSKEVPNHDTVSQMNSNNPPNNIPSNLCEASNTLADHAPATVVPALPASEDQTKTHQSRKNSKSRQSKLKFPERNGVPLPKSNGEISESNEGRGSDPSNLANVSNLKIGAHHANAKISAPLFELDPLKLAKIPLISPLDPCEGALDGTELIKEGDMTSQGALEGPTVSKSERNKSKKKALNVQNSSETSEHAEIQDYGSQTLVQPSGDMETEQGKKIIDTVVSYDPHAQHKKPDPSSNRASSSESTEDTPHHLRRFRVVRKIPIRRQKRIPSISNP